MTKTTIAVLRVILVILFTGAVLAQVIVPLMGYQFVTESFPEVRHLLVPYCLAADLAFVCVEVALVAVWQLLAMVSQDQIFTERAFRWVRVLIACPAIAAALSALVGLHMVISNTGNLTAVLSMAGLVALGAGIALLMVVMRELLRTAISYRDELSEVI